MTLRKVETADERHEGSREAGGNEEEEQQGKLKWGEGGKEGRRYTVRKELGVRKAGWKGLSWREGGKDLGPISQ